MMIRLFVMANSLVTCWMPDQVRHDGKQPFSYMGAMRLIMSDYREKNQNSKALGKGRF